MLSLLVHLRLLHLQQVELAYLGVQEGHQVVLIIPNDNIFGSLRIAYSRLYASDADVLGVICVLPEIPNQTEIDSSKDLKTHPISSLKYNSIPRVCPEISPAS